MTVATETELDTTENDLDDEQDDERPVEADLTSPQLRLDGMDDRGVDKLRLVFGGTIELERTSPAAVRLVRRLRLGATELELVPGLTVRVAGKGDKAKFDSEGYYDHVVRTVTVKVLDVDLPTALDGEA
jgi:hypothetical protein